jgi:hypothetical protein
MITRQVGARKQQMESPCRWRARGSLTSVFGSTVPGTDRVRVMESLLSGHKRTSSYHAATTCFDWLEGVGVGRERERDPLIRKVVRLLHAPETDVEAS